MEASPRPMAAPTGHPSQVGEGRLRAVAGRGLSTGVQRGWGHFKGVCMGLRGESVARSGPASSRASQLCQHSIPPQQARASTS